MTLAMQVGDEASLEATLTDQSVEAFAAVVGDRNPLHLDDGFASGSRFGSRIGHGMWVGSLISAVLGTKLPGPGTIYLSQSLRFHAPVYIGETVTATVRIVRIRDDKPVVELEATCRNERGEVLVTGEAIVLVD